MASDRIVLTVPAREEYARTVRMTAVALVGRLGVPIDLVDDVRIAVEEAYVFAVRRTQPGGDVTFTFTVGDGRFACEVGPLAEVPEKEDADESGERYAVFILDSVCDEFELAERPDGTHVRLCKDLV
jgi:anti-sigma regulatory factor (Ser/Thr protein kinase)